MNKRHEEAAKKIREAAVFELPNLDVELRIAKRDTRSLAGLLVAKGVATRAEVDDVLAVGMEAELVDVQAHLEQRKADAEEMAARAKAAAEAEARAKLEEEQKAIEAWAEVQRAKIARQVAEQRAKLAGASAEPKPAE